MVYISVIIYLIFATGQKLTNQPNHLSTDSGVTCIGQTAGSTVENPQFDQGATQIGINLFNLN